MGQMINTGKELIRISPKDAHKLEYSTSEGRTWLIRYSGSSCGEFQDLTNTGKELLATTSKGLFYSNSSGRSWLRRN